MARRSYGVLTLLVSVLLAGFAGFAPAIGADAPVVLDLTDPTFSTQDRATILSAATVIDGILGESYPVPSFRLIARGWLDRDFVIYTAGRIEAAGYAVSVVEGEDAAGENQLWILVAVPLDGRTAWIPVEAGLPETGFASRLGSIPWSGSPGSPFLAPYAQFDHIIALAPNTRPSVSFMAVGQVVVEERTAFHAAAQDPDGTIIAFIWYVGDEQVAIETTPIYNHVFKKIRERVVTLVVIDNRGAEATATREVEVLAEGGCGCH